jgi:hypothetical protein
MLACPVRFPIVAVLTMIVLIASRGRAQAAPDVPSQAVHASAGQQAGTPPAGAIHDRHDDSTVQRRYEGSGKPASCYNCGGSGKCWNCCGSGKTSARSDCYMCRGTGKCYYCGGTGAR